VGESGIETEKTSSNTASWETSNINKFDTPNLGKQATTLLGISRNKH
jgi:hypothetical protein